MKKLQELISLVLLLASPLAMAGSANPLSTDFEGTITRVDGKIIQARGIDSIEIFIGDTIKAIKGSIQLSYERCQNQLLTSGQWVEVRSGCGEVLPNVGVASEAETLGSTTAMIIGGIVAAGIVVNEVTNDNNVINEIINNDNNNISP